MSMLASFVQVEPDLLERINADPSLVEQLFEPELPGAGFDSEKMRALILERGPQLLAGAIDLHPALREQIEERVGTTQEALRGGDGGDAVLALMQGHLGQRPRGAVHGAHAELSLDKAWHGVHYLLCGSVEPTETPLGQAVLGGTEVGEDFSGYGPARTFDPEQVARMAKALAAPGAEREAADRFDAARMTELQIYPFGWEDDDRDWLLVSFRDLRGFYADAAAQGWAAVACLV
jgi:hypothetical protein